MTVLAFHPPIMIAHANPTAKVAVDPPAKAGLNYTVGSRVTFTVNVTDAPPIIGFDVIIQYNLSVLGGIPAPQNPGVSVDTTGNVLGPDSHISVLAECIDLQGIGCESFTNSFAYRPPYGEVDVALAELGNFASQVGPNGLTSGLLFHVTFNIAGTGFSQLHLFQWVFETAGKELLQPVPSDGYFTNMDCPVNSSDLCKPLVVDFSYPSLIAAGAPALFNASSSRETNIGGNIVQYTWLWAEFAFFGSLIFTVSSNSTAVHVYTNPGNYTVILTVQDSYGITWSRTRVVQVAQPLEVSTFFTDSNLNPLPLDSKRHPEVNVALARGIVRNTSPSQIIAWVNITNTSGSSVQSLRLNDTLPIDWAVDPSWPPARGSIHVYYGNTTGLATDPEITQPSTITVSTGNPETVHLAISNLTATPIGHPLGRGESILLSVKLTYALRGTDQSFASYPRYYNESVIAATWSQASYGGAEASGTSLAIFAAHARVLGNLDGDDMMSIIDAYNSVV